MFVLPFALLVVVSEGEPSHPLPVLTKTTIAIQEGAPSSTVKALCYDDRGFLLVGTTAGLARYDGDRFDTFLADEHSGLDGDRIVALDADAEGGVWVGVHRAPPCRFENDSFERLCDYDTLHTVRQFLVSKDGTTWLAGHRLGRFQAGELTVLGRDEGLPDSRISRVAMDAEGALWVATGKGMYRQTASGFECVDKRAFGWVLADFDGCIWGQGRGGQLVPLSGPAAEPIDLNGARIQDECDHGGHHRLLATNTGILALAAGTEPGRRLQVHWTETIPSKEGAQPGICCLLPGPGRDIWIGTELQGLQYVESRYVQLLNVSPDAPGRPVSCVHPLSDGRALVTDGKLKMAFVMDEARQRTPIQTPERGDYQTRGVASTDAGTWVSTAAGVAKLEGDRLVPLEEWRGQGRLITAMPDGSVWAQMGRRLHQVAAAHGSAAGLQSFQLPAVGVSVLCAHGGSLLAGSGGQILRLDFESGEWSSIVEMKNAIIRSLRAGRSDELWISTYGQGLWRFGTDQRLDQWSVGEGLPDPFLSWIAPIHDDGELWINSNTGLLRVSVASLDAQVEGQVDSIDAQTFRAPEANGVYGAELGDGSLLLPTLEGLALFDRSAMPPPRASPHVLIRGPYVNGAPADRMERPRGRTNLRFEFTAPIFPTSSDSSFQYRMVEFDEHWTNAGGSREVRFPSLLAGDYTLEVRARTPRTKWSAPVRSQTLTVEPYWHDRTWVRWLLVAAAAIGLRSLVHLRTRALRQRNSALTDEMAQRAVVEARLGASEVRFRRLFQTAPSAILAWSPQGVLQDRNERANELFAWGDEESIEAKPWEHFDDSDFGSSVFQEAFADSKDLTFVAVTRVGDFQTKRCRWHFAATRSESGEVTSIIGMITDLSQQDRDARKLIQLRESLALAEESERSRIARELHDDLSQRLAVLALEAHMLDQSRADLGLESVTGVGSFQREVEEVSTHLHTLSRQLHPTIVDDLGLASALRSECSRRNRFDDTPIALAVHEDVENPPKETALALFRIAQEAIRNASRHADASEIEVELEVDGDWLQLAVRDDGKGMPASDANGDGGIGIKSMRERARLAGGDLAVGSNGSRGTRVVARVPRDAKAVQKAIALRNE